ncbi:MAG: hypothetical protein KGD64_10290 [Candidatus Heimdallarchaeota archaeon]|nr:hypothetical protein [Candidatus Heimdallarchaeota archaeon]
MSKKSVGDILNRKERYKKDILELLDTKERKVAYHFNCPDGIVSAAIMRYLYSLENLEFIPIDYALLKNKEIANKLKNANWFAIVDLEPFNIKTLEYFFDHHISNENKEINAKKHVFEAGAPSAASLIGEYFLSLLPDFLLELAKMTEITDTASYSTPPPLELEEEFTQSWDRKIWLLEDACKTAFSVHQHGELVEILANEGLKGVFKGNIQKRVKKLRTSRKRAFDIVHEIKKTDFVIIIDRPVHYNISFIAGEVMKNGSIGAAYITEYPDEVKISFRLSKALSDKEIDKFRVDLLAQSMSGGGHKPASGAETETLEEALTKIEHWGKNLNFDIETIDLRERE